MADTILLVDLENVGKVDLKNIPEGVRVTVFFGAQDKKVSMELVDALVDRQERFTRIKIGGHGRNSLDFHIAFYLGVYFQKEPKSNCVVFTKDKDLDPLIQHLSDKGFGVRRVETLAELSKPVEVVSKRVTAKSGSLTSAIASKPPESIDAFTEILDCITKVEKQKRPKKHARLVAYMVNRFKKKYSALEVEKAVSRLIAENLIAESNGAISYKL